MNMEKRKILQYVGEPSQLFGIEEFTFNSGKARGVRAAHVRTGSGLEYTVFADRCMDIGRVSYKGCNISFMTPTGIVGPQYYEAEGLGFLRSFFGGAVTTCGLTHFGGPCMDGEEQLGLHGVASSLAAEEFGVRTTWEDGKDPEFEINGRMRQASFYGPNIILNRRVFSKYGDDSIYISDSFTNNGFDKQPFMHLYHINIGYPVVQPESFMVFSSKSYECADEYAVKYEKNMYKCQEPTDGFVECVYFHELRPVEENKSVCAVINPSMPLGVAVWSDVDELGHASHWDMFGKGNYVVGLSQGNSHGKGRAAARADGTLQYLEPGETKTSTVRLEILHDADRIEYIKNVVK